MSPIVSLVIPAMLTLYCLLFSNGAAVASAERVFNVAESGNSRHVRSTEGERLSQEARNALKMMQHRLEMERLNAAQMEKYRRDQLIRKFMHGTETWPAEKRAEQEAKIRALLG